MVHAHHLPAGRHLAHLSGLRVLRKFLHVTRHGFAQPIHERLDFLLRRPTADSVFKRFLGRTQGFERVGKLALFERNRYFPHQRHGRFFVVAFTDVGEAMANGAQAQINAVIVPVEKIRPDGECVHGAFGGVASFVAVNSQPLALFDDRAR